MFYQMDMHKVDLQKNVPSNIKTSILTFINSSDECDEEPPH